MKGKYLILSLVPVLLLSGCKWFGSASDSKKADGSAAVAADTSFPAGVLAVWADGTTMLDEKEFNEVFEMATKEQPELKNLPDTLKPVLQQQLLNSLVQQKLIEKDIKEKGIDKTAEYQTKVEQIKKAITQKVNVDFFIKEFNEKVTDKDKRDYYNMHKDRFALVAKGGVKAAGVKFGTEADAKAFLSKVAGKVAEFDKLVKADAKLSKDLQDFNYVNAESAQIDQVLKDGILAIAKAPHVTMIKVNDKTFWIVKATDKKASQYRSYEELKDQLEAPVKQAKQSTAVGKKLEELATKYGVKVKEGAFAPKPGAMPAGQPVAPAQVADASGAEQAQTAVAENNAQDLEKATKAA